MPLRIERAQTSQATVLTNIMHIAKGHWGYDPEDMKEFREHWQITPEMIEKDPFLIVLENEQPLGFARIIQEAEQMCLLDCLFVLPQAHGKGYGTWLLEAAEEVAKSQQCTSMRLESDAHAAPFYARHGYHATGSRPSAFKQSGPIQLMEKDLSPPIYRLNTVDLHLNTSEPWQFEEENAQAIKVNWQTLVTENPDLWDGKVLSLYNYSIHGNGFSGRLVEVNYSAFLAWRDWGFPDRGAKNLFGCVVLRSKEGHLIFGKMASNTATAGLVYPPGGNLDLNDIRSDGTVDIFGSIARELEEETGFKIEDGELGDILVINDGPRIAIARILTLPLSADTIRAKISHFNANLENPELEDAFVITSTADLQAHRVPPYAKALTAHLLN